jgi:hypothetical protein
MKFSGVFAETTNQMKFAGIYEKRAEAATYREVIKQLDTDPRYHALNKLPIWEQDTHNRRFFPVNEKAKGELRLQNGAFGTQKFVPEGYKGLELLGENVGGNVSGKHKRIVMNPEGIPRERDERDTAKNNLFHEVGHAQDKNFMNMSMIDRWMRPPESDTRTESFAEMFGARLKQSLNGQDADVSHFTQPPKTWGYIESPLTDAVLYNKNGKREYTPYYQNAANVALMNLHNQKQDAIGFDPLAKNGKHNPYIDLPLEMNHLLDNNASNSLLRDTADGKPDRTFLDTGYQIPSNAAVHKMNQVVREAMQASQPFFDAQNEGFEAARKEVAKYPQPRPGQQPAWQQRIQEQMRQMPSTQQPAEAKYQRTGEDNETILNEIATYERNGYTNVRPIVDAGIKAGKTNTEIRNDIYDSIYGNKK